MEEKVPPIEADTSCFPCEIMENILSRLPVQSLLRFKAVSKSWNAIIEDSGFARIHSNQLKMSNSQSFRAVGRYRNGKCILVNFQSLESNVQSAIKFPSTEFDCAKFVCGCEGILVFLNERKFMLWNPFTGNYSSFPCPHEDLIGLGPSYGVCFDKYQDDYKVIVAFREGKYLVYSIKNDSWAERQTEFREFSVEEGTYVDGFVYWIVWGNIVDSIIYFDPKDDMLKELARPTDLEEERSLICLTNLNGNLFLYALDDAKMFKLWMLRGRKCWTKLMAIRNDQLCDPTIKNEPFWSFFFRCCLQNQNFGKLPSFCHIIQPACLESLNFPRG